MKRRYPPLLERFHAAILVTPGCWWWEGTRTARGYGQLKDGHTQVLAHRLSYRHYVGEIPEGLILRHRCNNSLCVNPDHLIPGTHAENKRDSVLAGTAADKGIKNPAAKLTEEQVHEIRRLYSEHVPAKELAERFGMSHAAVWAVATRRSWRHL